MPSAFHSQHANAFRPYQTRHRLPVQTRRITIARVDHFLRLEACDRPDYFAWLDPCDPPDGVALFVTEVVRRVVAGTAKPNVLTAIGSRAAVPLLLMLSQTRSVTRQSRIRRALAEIAPAIALDTELVTLFGMACWSRAGAARNGSASLPAARDSPVTGGT